MRLAEPDAYNSDRLAGQCKNHYYSSWSERFFREAAGPIGPATRKGSGGAVLPSPAAFLVSYFPFRPLRGGNLVDQWSSQEGIVSISPLLVYIIVLVGFVATNLLLAYIAAPRKRTIVKEMPYESGMDPVGDARQPFDVKFYVVAILFLVFDVELLYLYPWAVTAYAPIDASAGAGIPLELRGTVFAVMLAFIATLVIAYIYAWRKGVFRWR